MKRREDPTDANRSPSRDSGDTGQLASARRVTPISRRAFVRLASFVPWRIIVVLVGLAVQVVLLWMAGELVDLYVSAVELWAELARKHLELQLS